MKFYFNFFSNSAFASHQVRRLFWGHALSLVGTSFSYVAFMQKINELTGSSSQWGYLAIVKAVPYIIFGLFFGYLIDSFDRRRILLVCEISRALIFIAISQCQTLNLFYLLVFLSSVFDVAYEPAYKSVLTSLLKKEQLFRMNSLGETTRSLCIIIGVGCSGLMISALSTKGCFIIDAGTYLISAFNLLSLPRILRKSSELQSVVSRDFFYEISEGLRVIWRKTQIHDSVLVWTSLILLTSFEAPMFFPLMDQKNWGGASAAAFVYVAICIGSLVTSLFLWVQKLSPVQTYRQLSFLILIDALAIFGIAQTSSFYFALVLSTLLGVTETVFRTYSITNIQKSLSEDLIGRVFSAISMIHEPIKLLAMSCSAILVTRYSPFFGFNSAAILEVGIALYLLLKYLKRDSRYELSYSKLH